MAIIEIENVSYSYNVDSEPVSILRDVNIRVEAGELVAIQGPSGSGKSTLLYLLGGLLNITAGAIRIHGVNIAQLSSDEMAIFRNRHIGFIFQQFHLLPRTSVLKNILLPNSYPFEFERKPPNVERAQELANRLGLGERLDHVPNQLSGGQQQRVAIARALMNDARIILADEPTGSLDSKASQQTMELLKELNEQGLTIVIITHDREVALQCHKVFHFRDGKIQEVEELRESKKVSEQSESTDSLRQFPGYLSLISRLLPLSFDNLRRNGVRSLLTMMGVTIGIAAVVSMITLGQFTKQKILESYEQMGVNTMGISGYPNWELKATDVSPVVYDFFNWQTDIVPLKQVFPQIAKVSPQLFYYNIKASYAGKLIDSNAHLLGVSDSAMDVLRLKVKIGRPINHYHVETKDSVCVIGYDIAGRLFSNITPLGRILFLADSKNSYGCRVIGVLERTSGGNESTNRNMQIFVPYTFFQVQNGDWWATQMKDLLIQLKPTADVEKVGRGIKAYFQAKYGASARFYLDSEVMLLAQMKKFLSLFTIMLGAIALVSLTVGGIGITNMMLVSVSERFREIGLRKTLGATNRSIRGQFLMESMLLCLVAGAAGIGVGILTYQSLIWGASHFVPKLQFEWVFDKVALLLSLVATIAVGIFSGLFPAFKAERLQIVEALRAE